MTAPLHGRPESIQEEQYTFPYHYIPSEDAGFRHALFLRWGYEYQSYLRFVLEMLGELRWQTLLDVGCGDGRLIYEIGRRFPERECAGIDFSERAIKQAQAMNPSGRYIAGDVCDDAIVSGSFDLVTLIEVLEHIPPAEVDRFLGGVKRRLARGGKLLLTVPSTNMKLSPKHYRHFTLESLREALLPHFSIGKHYYLNRNSWTLKLIENLLVNPVFIVRERLLLSSLIRVYRRFFLHAGEASARRVVALCEPI